MMFLADESIDRQIVDRLREDSHAVLCVAEMDPGISDDTVLSLANEKGAVLLTADRGFEELIFRQKKISEGIILIWIKKICKKKEMQEPDNLALNYS